MILQTPVLLSSAMVRPNTRSGLHSQYAKSSPGYRIKTQDAILGEFATERLVEIGPAETLTNMASKTVEADYRVQDLALGVQRELLSYNRNADAIYYDSPDQVAPTAVTTSSTSAVPSVAAPPATGPAPTGSSAVISTVEAAATVPTPATVSIPDKEVSPREIITTLVALALAKDPSNIAQDQTLKALCGGRSIRSAHILGLF